MQGWWSGGGVLFIWGEVKEFIRWGGELIGPLTAGVNQYFLGFKSVGVKVYGLEKKNELMGFLTVVGWAEGIQDWRQHLRCVPPRVHQVFCVCLCTERLCRNDFVLHFLVIVYSRTSDDPPMRSVYSLYIHCFKRTFRRPSWCSQGSADLDSVTRMQWYNYLCLLSHRLDARR